MELSVVLPARNEASCIGLLLREIHGALAGNVSFEVVLVDDGSDDGTADVARRTAAELGCTLRLLRHRQSCGQSTAISTAVSHAAGALIATLDADGQNDPADIPAMLELAARQRDRHFCIAGYRKRRHDSRWKKFQSRFANRIRSALLQDGVPDTGCGLKVFPRETFLQFPYFDHMHRYLPALTRRLGGTVVIHEVNHRPRAAGVSKYTAWNRAWVGVMDILGVRWLQRRNKLPETEALQ